MKILINLIAFVVFCYGMLYLPQISAITRANLQLKDMCRGLSDYDCTEKIIEESRIEQAKSDDEWARERSRLSLAE